VRSAGQGCCAPWAEKGSAWAALDAYGQLVGTAQVANCEFYDFTQCYELTLSKVSGSPGVGLYVSTATPWQSPASAQWVPSRAERAGLAAVVSRLEKAMVPSPKYPCGPPSVSKTRDPADARALFFRSVDAEGTTHEEAVIGGPLLIIAERQARGSWVAHFVDAQGADACLPRLFAPKAVFDMNGDGSLEIVVHTDEGTFFGDLIYGFEAVGGWHVAARGIPGSTA
jgi:hypothetical protein